MFAIKLHSKKIKQVKIPKTVDFCITLYPNQTSVEKSTTRKERVNTFPKSTTTLIFHLNMNHI